MPEIEVEVSINDCPQVEKARMKLKRVIRFNHLSRDFVDEDDYPPTQEYFLYSDKTTAYLSHCPNRHPDFQQIIQLDSIPVPHENGNERPKDILYKVKSNNKDHSYFKCSQEAVERGVVIYLPEIHTGG